MNVKVETHQIQRIQFETREHTIITKVISIVI